MSKPINHLEDLCYYDPRNPECLPPLDGDEPREPRNGCACDNCFYGRDRLALRIIELESALGDTKRSLADRDGEIVQLKHYCEKCMYIKEYQTKNTSLRAEVERLKDRLFRIEYNGSFNSETARKQAAQECMQICDDLESEGYHHEINNHAVVKDRIAAKFGLEG